MSRTKLKDKNCFATLQPIEFKKQFFHKIVSTKMFDVILISVIKRGMLMKNIKLRHIRLADYNKVIIITIEEVRSITFLGLIS